MTRINGQRVSAEIRGVCGAQHIFTWSPTDEAHGGAQDIGESILQFHFHFSTFRISRALLSLSLRSRSSSPGLSPT